MPKRYWKFGLATFLLLAVAAGSLWAYRNFPGIWRTNRFGRAEQALAADNLGEAANLLSQSILDQPNDWRAHLLYARAMRRLGRTCEAEMALERAAESGMPEAEGRREFALLEARQDFVHVSSELQKLARQRPDDVEVLRALAEGASSERRWGLAEQAYSAWIEVEPSRIDLLYERGYARWRDRQFTLAAADLREVVRRSPHPLFSMRVLLAKCLLSDARIDEAEAEFRNCHLLHPEHADPLVGLAVCATEHGQLDRSQALLRDALSREPNSTWALNELGNLCLFGKDYQQAVAAFRRLLRISPKDTEGYRKLAQALRKTGDRAGAEDAEKQYQVLKQTGERAPAGVSAKDAPGKRDG